MLQHAAASCARFGHCFGEVLQEKPPSVGRPYTIVLYSDEVSPGNQLKHTNRRKLQVVYWSLQELGSLRLTNESSWFRILRFGLAILRPQKKLTRPCICRFKEVKACSYNRQIHPSYVRYMLVCIYIYIYLLL